MNHESYRKFCDEFCNGEYFEDITKHFYIMKYFSAVEYRTEKSIGGIIATDSMGIYTPIQDLSAGVPGFERYPPSRQNVCSLSDGYRSAYTIIGNFYIIFTGVCMTNHGYKFVEPFSIYPTPATTPSHRKKFIIPKVENSTSASEVDRDDYDDDFDEENLSHANLRRELLASSDDDSD